MARADQSDAVDSLLLYAGLSMIREILHSDIKPANIIPRPDSCGAVLCDFGLALSSTEHSNGGTPNYIAPECLRGWDERSFPLDVFAFGVTMVFVTGHVPRPQGDWCIADITKKTVARTLYRGSLYCRQQSGGFSRGCS